MQATLVFQLSYTGLGYIIYKICISHVNQYYRFMTQKHIAIGSQKMSLIKQLSVDNNNWTAYITFAMKGIVIFVVFLFASQVGLYLTKIFSL